MTEPLTPPLPRAGATSCVPIPAGSVFSGQPGCDCLGVTACGAGTFAASSGLCCETTAGARNFAVKMYVPTTHGASVAPTELKACASVKRAGAVSSGPRLAAYGFAEVCNAVTPAPGIKIAARNSGNETICAAGRNINAPTTWMNSATIIVFL